MKKILTIFLLILLPLCSFGQKKNNKVSQKVIKFKDNVDLPLTSKEKLQIDEVYGEYAEKYVYNDSHRLKAIKHLLRNRVEIKKIGEEDNKKPFVLLSKIPLNTAFVKDLKRDSNFNANDFNPLKYNFNLFTKNGGMYRVDGTNTFIIIKSQYQ